MQRRLQSNPDNCYGVGHAGGHAGGRRRGQDDDLNGGHDDVQDGGADVQDGGADDQDDGADVQDGSADDQDGGADDQDGNADVQDGGADEDKLFLLGWLPLNDRRGEVLHKKDDALRRMWLGPSHGGYDEAGS